MSDAPVLEVDLADLGPRTRLATGGQGTVFALAEEPGLVYKEYATRFVDDVDVATLNRFVRLAAGAGEDTGAAGAGEDTGALLGLAAWPTAIVRKEGVVRGFLMPRVPDHFTVELALPSGPSTVLAQVQYLLNSDDYLRDRGLLIDNRMRLEILRDIGEALALLHRLGICVGDFSPNNLLFSLTARPRCYFLDCDAMRLDGDSVLEQAETPEWHMPAPEELGTPASDAYKFGLLAVRLFAGDQQVRDPAAARRRLDPGLRRLAARSLGADPALRPYPGQWLEPLDRTIARTPPEPPPEPVPSRPIAAPRRVVPQPVRVPLPVKRPRWPIYAGAAAALIPVLIGVFNNDDTETTSSRIPPGFSLPAGEDPFRLRQQPGLPTPDPGSILSSAYPGLFPTPRTSGLLNSALLPLICIPSEIEVGSGLNRQSARVKAAVTAVEEVMCPLNNLRSDDVLPTGSKTQRARATELEDNGPYKLVRIIGVRGGSGGQTQVNVVFEPALVDSPTCLRSRLSVAREGEGYVLASLTDPVAYSCP
ncbi:hypothetical protein [Actinoplanes sp. GCM10030250]|uniref:hypothetical protein n=1 Tax=Actinoplanes sp. GCM10030250 TaxID=3273376 RepID=UPI0036075DC4